MRSLQGISLFSSHIHHKLEQKDTISSFSEPKIVLRELRLNDAVVQFDFNLVFSLASEAFEFPFELSGICGMVVAQPVWEDVLDIVFTCRSGTERACPSEPPSSVELGLGGSDGSALRSHLTLPCTMGRNSMKKRVSDDPLREREASGIGLTA